VTPLTPAGQALSATLAYDADPPRYEPGDYIARYRDAIEEAERQAADRALAELRREVETWFRKVVRLPEEGADSIDAEIGSLFIAFLALIDKASKPEEGA
jgi:hypothetical protein